MFKQSLTSMNTLHMQSCIQPDVTSIILNMTIDILDYVNIYDMTLYCSLHVEVFLRYTKDNWCYYHSHIIIIKHSHPATMSALWMLNFISMFLKLQNSQCSQCTLVQRQSCHILTPVVRTSGWRRSDLVWEPLVIDPA